jgi:hypothetical protein
MLTVHLPTHPDPRITTTAGTIPKGKSEMHKGTILDNKTINTNIDGTNTTHGGKEVPIKKKHTIQDVGTRLSGRRGITVREVGGPPTILKTDYGKR